MSQEKCLIRERDLQRVKRWVYQTAEKYCPNCEDKCCNASKHAIAIREYELEPFKEKGIPVFSMDNFNFSDLVNWRNNFSSKILTKEGKEIVKPSLIETRVGMKIEGTKNFTLNVEKDCPLYTEEGRCSIHEDERRPKICKFFPVFPLGYNNFFCISPLCKPFNKQEVREDFRRNFSEPRFKLGIILEGGEVFGEHSSKLNELEYGREVPNKEK